MRGLCKNADIAVALAILCLLLIAKPRDEAKLAGEPGLSATALTNPDAHTARADDRAPPWSWSEKSYIGRVRYKLRALASRTNETAYGNASGTATGRMPVDPDWEPASALEIDEDLWGLDDGRTVANWNANDEPSGEPAWLESSDSPFVGRLEASSGSPDVIVPVSFSDVQSDDPSRRNVAAPDD
jgi:hypothetical protein